MEGSYAFTCQVCRARLTLVGSLEAAPGTDSVSWVGSRGLLVPPHLQASVFDHTNVDESFIVLDGKRQGPHAGHPLPHPHPFQPQPHPTQPQPQPTHPLPPHQPRGLEESFVVLGSASVLRQPPGHHHPPHSLIPLHFQALQAQQQQQLLAQQAPAGPPTASTSTAPPSLKPGPTAPGSSPSPSPSLQPNTHRHHQQQLQPTSSGGHGPGPSPLPTRSSSQSPLAPTSSSPSSHTQSSPPQQVPHGALPPVPSLQPAVLPSGQSLRQAGAQHPHASSPSMQPQGTIQHGHSRRSGLVPGGSVGAGGPGGGEGPGGLGGGGGGLSGGDGEGGGGGGGAAGSGLDDKLQALAQLFELASTNTQVDHPLCMDCVTQLTNEIDMQIKEAKREVAAYGACLAQLEGGRGTGAGEGGGSAGGWKGGSGSGGREAEEYQLEEISRMEQERDQERARAEVLESELALLAGELSSLAAASADLDSLEERYLHDVADFELLLRGHTDERGALLAKIDRAGQRLQLLKNTSVLYDAFKIWHDGPFGTISGFRLGRTPEVPVEWDEINAAWGQAVLLLHTMAQMCKLQFSQHRLLPMGSHPRLADKRSTYDLFGPVSKLWSANYDRAMVGFLACLKEFGEHARHKDTAEGKPMPFNFPFVIDGDKVNNHTIKLTLNKDARWTKALKFMLANLKIALQWCVKQDQSQEAPTLQQLHQEGPLWSPEH